MLLNGLIKALHRFFGHISAAFYEIFVKPKPLKMQNMPLFAIREHDEVYHLEVDIKMKIFSFLRNALQTTKKTEKKSVSYKITLPLLNVFDINLCLEIIIFLITTVCSKLIVPKRFI